MRTDPFGTLPRFELGRRWRCTVDEIEMANETEMVREMRETEISSRRKRYRDKQFIGTQMSRAPLRDGGRIRCALIFRLCFADFFSCLVRQYYWHRGRPCAITVLAHSKQNEPFRFARPFIAMEIA
jgi:hypothetical protein